MTSLGNPIYLISCYCESLKNLWKTFKSLQFLIDIASTKEYKIPDKDNIKKLKFPLT